MISKGTQRLVFMPYLVIFKYFPIAGFYASFQIKCFLLMEKILNVLLKIS